MHTLRALIPPADKILFLLPCVFLLLGKTVVAGPGWIYGTIALLACSAVAFLLFRFRIRLTKAIRAIRLSALAWLPVPAAAVFLAGVLYETDAVSSISVLFAVLAHLILICFQDSFRSSVFPFLTVSLGLQYLVIAADGTPVAILSLAAINIAAFFLLARRHKEEPMIRSNKIAVLAALVLFLAAMLCHPVVQDCMHDGLIQAIYADALGWAEILRAGWLSRIALLYLLVGVIFDGIPLIRGRSSAALLLIASMYLLLSPWHTILEPVLFTAFFSYILWEPEYITLEDLTDMEEVPEDLERKVLSTFLDYASKPQDLARLESYVISHPTFHALHVYLHAAWNLLSEEEYYKVVAMVENYLGMTELDILLPQPEIYLPEDNA